MKPICVRLPIPGIDPYAWLKQIRENIVQMNYQVIVQVARKFHNYHGLFLVRHFLQLLVGVERVDVIKYITSALQGIDFDRSLSWVHDPILRDATGFIYAFLISPVILCCAGGENLYHQIRSTVDAVSLDFTAIADHHHIGNEHIFLCQNPSICCDPPELR